MASEQGIVLFPVPAEKVSQILAELGSIRELIRDEIKAAGLKENGSKYLSRSQVSKMLSVSLVTLDAYIKTGKLKAYRFGQSVRIKEADVEQALTVINTGRK